MQGAVEIMIKKIRALPHILLFKRSANRAVIEKDMLRWFQVYKPKLPKNSVTETLVWLLEKHPEFGNLFFLRLGHYSGIPGRLLLFLARNLYKPPRETLRFGEPLDMGPGFFARIGFGCIVAAEKIGENCWINPSVTIGYKDDKGGLPSIGSNVYIGTGAKILGPVTIGDNVVIGANAVVIKNVPSNCTVAGLPARIIKRDGEKVREALHASNP
jgi:serine O-acetyltransferase